MVRVVPKEILSTFCSDPLSQVKRRGDGSIIMMRMERRRDTKIMMKEGEVYIESQSTSQSGLLFISS